tara:strand:- start:216 stop:431 length:216 start_codon:yes stop_codon:yes gene_type:complete
VKLVEALRKGNVNITYESLNSGKEITKTYTLKTIFKVNFSLLSNKLIAYDVEAREWEDIEKSTIKKWSINE